MPAKHKQRGAYKGPTSARRAADERWREKQLVFGIKRVSIPMDSALLEELDRRARHFDGNSGQRRAALLAELLAEAE